MEDDLEWREVRWRFGWESDASDASGIVLFFPVTIKRPVESWQCDGRNDRINSHSSLEPRQGYLSHD